MGILEDLMKALERVPGWKRIAAMPAEVDALRERVEALERSRGLWSRSSRPLSQPYRKANEAPA